MNKTFVLIGALAGFCLFSLFSPDKPEPSFQYFLFEREFISEINKLCQENEKKLILQLIKITEEVYVKENGEKERFIVIYLNESDNPVFATKTNRLKNIETIRIVVKIAIKNIFNKLIKNRPLNERLLI